MNYMVRVTFSIGKYTDTVECDVVPMTVCQLLLGRPWQYDRSAVHDGRTNRYTFRWNNMDVIWKPLTPQQIVNSSMQKIDMHVESAHERENHLSSNKKREGEKNLVMLATKSEMIEFSKDPNLVHVVLLYKDALLSTNDITSLPSGVVSVLQDFSDVFPEEVPAGLPPIRRIEHKIDLIPGASLPNRPSYRTNPEETKEI